MHVKYRLENDVIFVQEAMSLYDDVISAGKVLSTWKMYLTVLTWWYEKTFRITGPLCKESTDRHRTPSQSSMRFNAHVTLL